MIYNYEAGMDTDAGLLTRIKTMPSSFRLVQQAHAVVREKRWMLRVKPVPPPAPLTASVRPLAAGTKVVAGSASETARLIDATCGDAQGVEMEGLGVLYAAHANREDALAHYAASGDTAGRWQTLRFIGQALLDRGNHEDARRALEEAQVLASELGRERLIAQTHYWISQVCLASGDIAGAQAAFDAVFDVYRDDTGIGHAYAAHGLGDIARRTDEHGVAERHLAVAADLAREGGDAVLEGRVWLSTAALHQARGDLDEQAAALEQAAAVFAGCGASYLEMRALAALAQVMADRGDTAAAGAAWARVESLWSAAGLPEEDRIHRRPAL